MTQHDLRLATAARIERAVAFIADHLDDTLSLERLAEIACYSPWHFHRVYVGVTGETVQDTVRRLRLHRAAVELGRDDRAIAMVARSAGYGSAAAFSRAFAAAYGTPPGVYRRRRHALRPELHTSGDPDMSTTPSFGPEPAPLRSLVRYDVTIEAMPPMPVLALAHRGDYHEIGRAFDRLIAWAAPRGLIGPQGRLLGLYYDDPAATPRGELRSDACLSVPDGTEPGPDMRVLRVGGWRAAAILHKGPYADLDLAYAYLYRTWLPASGEEPGDAPTCEEYLNDPREVAPTELLTRLRLPLKG